VWFELKSGTDCAVHALFDPASVLHIINDATQDFLTEDVLEQDVEQGHLFLYSQSTDGGVTFRIIVGEPEDEERIALASHRVAGALLRVPSGRLYAAGMEYLCRPGEPPVSAEEYSVWPEWMGQTAAVPAGDYLLDAYEAPDEERPPTRLDRWVGWAACLGCLATLVGTALAISLPLVGVLAGEDWRWVWFYWKIGVLIVWPPILIAWKVAARLPTRRQWEQRQEELRERFPFDVLIVLRPLPESVDPSSLRGAFLQTPLV